MKNPEDYPKINPPSTNKYVSEREIAFIQSCFDPEQKKKEEQYILPLKTTPDVINQKRKQLIEIFSYFDKDQTGLINVPELRNVMELLQVPPHRRQCHAKVSPSARHGNAAGRIRAKGGQTEHSRSFARPCRQAPHPDS